MDIKDKVYQIRVSKEFIARMKRMRTLRGGDLAPGVRTHLERKLNKFERENDLTSEV